MKRIPLFFVLAILAVLSVPSPGLSQSRELLKTDDLSVTWGGYIKSLAILSASDARESWDGALRLRLKTEANYRDRVTLTLHYEVTALLGEALADPAYRRAALSDPDELANLSWAITGTDELVLTHTLDRAYLTIRADRLTLILGRQRIGWGVARFISPTDLFVPFEPTALDKEEKRGVDAATAEIALGDYTGMSLVLAPTTDMDGASYAARFYTNLFDYDLSVMAGRFKDREVYGCDFSGQVKDVAIWGECAWYMEDGHHVYPVADPSSFFGFSLRESRREYLRAAFGAQYIFPSTLSFTLEYYYNGKGEQSKDDYDWSTYLSGTEPVLARNYLYGSVGYEITPLLIGNFSTMANLDDGSVLLLPSIEYSVTEDLYVRIGAQIGLGEELTEYEERPDIYYLQVGWYF